MLSTKLVIKMSRSSMELLFNFLQRNNLWALLGIVNEHIDIEPQERIQSELRPLEGLQVKNVGDEGIRINGLPVQVRCHLPACPVGMARIIVC